MYILCKIYSSLLFQIIIIFLLRVSRWLWIVILYTRHAGRSQRLIGVRLRSMCPSILIPHMPGFKVSTFKVMMTYASFHYQLNLLVFFNYDLLFDYHLVNSHSFDTSVGCPVQIRVLCMEFVVSWRVWVPPVIRALFYASTINLISKLDFVMFFVFFVMRFATPVWII